MNQSEGKRVVGGGWRNFNQQGRWIGKEYDIVSEIESTARTGLKISPEEQLNDKSEALTATSIKNENTFIECQRKHDTKCIMANQATGCKDAELGRASGLDK